MSGRESKGDASLLQAGCCRQVPGPVTRQERKDSKTEGLGEDQAGTSSLCI